MDNLMYFFRILVHMKWSQEHCPSKGKYIAKTWYINKVEYYLTLKKTKNLNLNG